MFLGARKRIVAVLYGVRKDEIAADQSTPIALKRISSVDLNDVDLYFEQLKGRADEWRNRHRD